MRAFFSFINKLWDGGANGGLLSGVAGDELYNYLIKNGRLTVDKTKKIFAQLVGAVSYVHMNHCVHRDLKLENILLDKHENVWTSACCFRGGDYPGCCFVLTRYRSSFAISASRGNTNATSFCRPSVGPYATRLRRCSKEKNTWRMVRDGSAFYPHLYTPPPPPPNPPWIQIWILPILLLTSSFTTRLCSLCALFLNTGVIWILICPQLWMFGLLV